MPEFFVLRTAKTLRPAGCIRPVFLSCGTRLILTALSWWASSQAWKSVGVGKNAGFADRGVGPRNVTASLSQVGSRADAMLLRSDLSVAPRFLWECLTNRIVSWVSAPAASNVACGFPALRSPVCFSSRVMRPIVLGQLSGEMRFAELDSR